MNPTILERVLKHSAELYKFFPNATIKDGMKLCKVLRKYEMLISKINEMDSNGLGDIERNDNARQRYYNEVKDLLQDHTGIMELNHDARGYALKIATESVLKHPDSRITRDFGGYGIIAPDLSLGSD